MRDYLLAASILAGTIIGAGIFSLPFLFNKLGLITGLIYLIGFSFIYFLIHWRYAQVFLANKGNYHFIHFVEKYISRFWAKASYLIIIGELLLSLTVYLILVPVFASLLFGKASFIYLFIFWVIGSILIFLKASWVGFLELIGGVGILFIVISLLLVGGEASFSLAPFKHLDFANIFLPFGPILFAFAGRPAVGKIIEIYRASGRKNKSFLKGAIFWGTIIPAVVYLMFVVAVLRLVPNVAPDTISSLNFLPPTVSFLIGGIGLLTLITSYLIIGGNVFDILRTDVFRKKLLSGLVAVFVPILLYFAGFQNFLVVVSVAGGIFLSFEAIFVNIMWSKVAKTKTLWQTAPIYLVFAAAIFYELYKVLV